MSPSEMVKQREVMKAMMLITAFVADCGAVSPTSAAKEEGDAELVDAGQAPEDGGQVDGGQLDAREDVRADARASDSAAPLDEVCCYFPGAAVCGCNGRAPEYPITWEGGACTAVDQAAACAKGTPCTIGSAHPMQGVCQ
jgi:hypothetical protein